MATYRENNNRISQWDITSDNDTWIVGAKATFDIVDAFGIDEGSHTGSTIEIYGDLNVSGALAGAVRLNGSDTSLSIGRTSRIVTRDGADGVISGAAGATITNEGVIRSASSAVYCQLWGHVVNEGTIKGNDGIYFAGEGASVENNGLISAVTAVTAQIDGFELVNGKKGVIESDGSAAMVFLPGTGTGEIRNYGVMTAPATAVGTGGTLFVTNRGRIEGDVYLGSGSSAYDGRKGVLDGRVIGGDGDDTFRLDSGKVTLVEALGGGFDRVFSSASIRLADNIEQLHLTGTRDVRARGNDDVNLLRGNNGDNRLFGLGGDDILDGRRGADRLSGGSGADIFVFNAGNRRDVVVDFEDGSDLISAGAIASENDFNVYKFLHMQQVGDDIVINFGKGDRLVIEDMMLGDLTYADFVQ